MEELLHVKVLMNVVAYISPGRWHQGDLTLDFRDAFPRIVTMDFRAPGVQLGFLTSNHDGQMGNRLESIQLRSPNMGIPVINSINGI